MALHPAPLSRANLEAALDNLIANQRGVDFQRIAVPLARERCPRLVANETSKDGGEDAYLIGTLPGGKTLAVACSITATWKKICDDIISVKRRKPHLDILWFYTPRGPTTVKTDPWVKQANERFNVELVVFPREEIIGQLLDPRHHYLVYQHLGLSNQTDDNVHRTATVATSNGQQSRKEHSVFERIRRLEKLDLYQVESFYKWPYESAVSRRIVAPADSLFLSCSLVSGTKYRCHSSNPAQFIDYGLVGHNFPDGESFEDSQGNPVWSDDVALPEKLWIQVEYVLFHSTQRTDDLKISRFRSAVAAHGIADFGLPMDCAPTDLAVGSFNDPWFNWYEMREAVRAPRRCLYISAIANLQYVNAHSIPKNEDFSIVQVSIFDYRPYTHPPSYLDLFARFDVYYTWFRHISGE